MSNDSSHGLQAYRANVTSQFGEDGVVAEITRRLGAGGRCCVEFGAWDGRHCSNTWSLWHDQGWSAVLIEGEPDRARALVGATASFPGVKVLNAYVGWEGASRLDALLDSAGLSGPVDVMSIDIDGDDFHVFAALEKHLPRILLIEFNPTCPPETELVQAKGGRFGSSAVSMLRLAEGKGYALAACTDTNLILVRAEEFPRLGIAPVRLAEVAPRHHLSYLMTDYDGRAYLDRSPVYAPQIAALDWRARLGAQPEGWSKFVEGQAQPARLFRAGD
jgi:hypothetical protein